MITRTRVLVNGERDATVRPGQTVTIGVRVAPDASGPVTVDVERFDPLAGWQFHTRFGGGRRAAARRSRSRRRRVGRWRVRATFDGTRDRRPERPGRARRSRSPSR